MDRSQKEGLVSHMREELMSSKLVVVTQQLGLSVSESTALRRAMRENGANYKVMKNTLAQIAIKGTTLEGLDKYMSGPTAFAYSKDPIAAAKAAVKFANTNDKLKVVGAILDGRLLSQAEVQALATLPSLDELRSKILCVINTPATQLAVVIKEPATSLVRVIQAKSKA